MGEALKRRWLALRNWRWKADRPYRLIAFALLPLVTVAILERLLAADELGWLRDWVKGSAIYGPLFFPEAATVEWKDRLQAILVLLGLPVAFCLWYWRDRNVRDQIEEQRKQVENQRKDINLTEFQEVQMRAAGALDEKLPAEAREQLQIAALHQMRGFLRGDYGESFRRPAFELLLAGHAAAMERIEIEKVRDEIRSTANSVTRAGILALIDELRTNLNRVDLERMRIIGDEKDYVFHSGFPLEGRSFDLLNLYQLKAPRGIRLAGSRFLGAFLWQANLGLSDLSYAKFEGVDLGAAYLGGAQLSLAHFEGANLSVANLEGAFLNETHLEGARLLGIDCGQFSELAGTVYSNSTEFFDLQFWRGGHPIPEEAPTADEIRNRWGSLGARHVDEPDSA